MRCLRDWRGLPYDVALDDNKIVRNFTPTPPAKTILKIANFTRSENPRADSWPYRKMSRWMFSNLSHCTSLTCAAIPPSFPRIPHPIFACCSIGTSFAPSPTPSTRLPNRARAAVFGSLKLLRRFFSSSENPVRGRQLSFTLHKISRKQKAFLHFSIVPQYTPCSCASIVTSAFCCGVTRQATTTQNIEMSR